MRHLCVLLVASLAFLFIAVSCGDSEPPIPAEHKAFLDAYKALNEHDYDTYLEYVDMEDNEDSTYADLLKMVLNQHQEYQEKKKGSVTDIEIVDSKKESETACTVFYRLSFSGNASEVSSQKMVCVDGDWKIKVRN